MLSVSPGEEEPELLTTVGIGEVVTGTVGCEIERFSKEVGHLGMACDIVFETEVAKILAV